MRRRIVLVVVAAVVVLAVAGYCANALRERAVARREENRFYELLQREAANDEALRNGDAAEIRKHSGLRLEEQAELDALRHRIGERKADESTR